MKIKIKDIELALKKIRSTSMSESVDFYVNDEISVILEFTDRNNNLAKAKLFDATINTTPEIISTQKIYNED